MMIYDVFLECVAHFVHEIYLYIGISRIDFAFALVYRQKDRLYARGGLGHYRGCARGCYGQTGYIAASCFNHTFIECLIRFTQTLYIRIVFFSLRIVDLKGSAFSSHCH